mmetsp:Transcript_43421/g.79428  ORF Transcript_43421/g.79428 Transcript_43421/m.79428 type:complete len:254 (-) Transcript_43421:41-802(-)
MWFGEFVPIGVVEASDARSEDFGGDEGGDAAGHVNDAGARKVVHATAERGVVIESREKAGRTPDGVYHDGVDESREHEGVAEVGLELAPFGDRSRHNGRGRRRERELEEPSNEITAISHIGEEESLVADEALLIRIGASIGEGVSHRPKTEGASTGIEQVLQHDILDILLTDASSAEHGKTCLHEEDHGSGEEEVEDIEPGVRFIGVGEGGAETGFDALGRESLQAEGGAVEIVCFVPHDGFGMILWMRMIMS